MLFKEKARAFARPMGDFEHRARQGAQGKAVLPSATAKDDRETLGRGDGERPITRIDEGEE